MEVDWPVRWDCNMFYFNISVDSVWFVIFKVGSFVNVHKLFSFLLIVLLFV